MNFSLNEVDAAAKKAARGAGYSWGLAEEAAFAVRWLCSFGFDGVGALANVLEIAENSELVSVGPNVTCDNWGTELNQMCPLLVGTALSDFAGIGTPEALTIQNVLSPILILPFAATVARVTGKVLSVQWKGVTVTADGIDIECPSDVQASSPKICSAVKIRTGGVLTNRVPRLSRVTPDDGDWAVLLRFAGYTYAPDTAASRQKGAGAGLLDND